jgi:hypothetical protein
MFTLLIATAGAWDILENSHGAELAWARMPVPYVVNPANDAGLDEEDVVLVIEAAVASWETGGTHAVQFDTQGEFDGGSAEYDGDNTIYFTQDWPHDPSLLALTSTWSTSDGTIVGFDMAINANQPWSTDGTPGTYDLENMLAHEFGHVLGLGHTEDDLFATMHATSVLGELTKRDLTEDDRDGLAYQYGELEAQETMGCSYGGRGAGFAAVFGLAMLGRRRRS